MSTLFTPGVNVPLTLNLEDGNINMFPQAKVYTNGTLVDTIDLTHSQFGRYRGTWTPPVSPALTYDVLYFVYTDSGHTQESLLYTREMEKWQPDTLVADAVLDETLADHLAVGSVGEALNEANVRAILNNKILKNKLELADGDTNNWVLYDDDDTTPLLTFSVQDKDGNAIVQQAAAPSRRTRGT
jgi:hypothetical protein